MHYLSSANIDEITTHLGAKEITYSHLYDDLVDHVCCEVESRMERGVDFKSAFNEIKQTIGVKRIMCIISA